MAEKIIVGFSGGIDSLVAASRLRDEGFDVRLVALQLHAGRPAADFRRRVAAAAAVLDLPLTIVDRAAVFQRQVVAYLRDSYRRGETPNPCIRCNARIKFPGLWQAMTDQDAAALATGHYVRRFPGPGGCWLLGPGADREKDQSYFLQMVDPAMLAAARFPLAELAKAEVTARAAALGFALRGYRESQELCFVSGGSYADLVEASEPAAGEIVDRDGTVLGRHHGVHRYTIGQRRGLGVAHPEPLYVLAIEPASNRIVVGERRHLYRRVFQVRELNWFIDPAACPPRLQVQIRYRHRPAPAAVEPRPDGSARVVFAEPQFAVTPGQGAAFYHDDRLVAGGWIA